MSRRYCRDALRPWFVLAFVLSGQARAESGASDCRPNPHLSQAKDEYERLEFDRAGRTLQRAIEYSRNCRSDLAGIYRLKAFVDAVQAERERCRRAFEIVLALEPEYRVPSEVPPKIRNCFNEALRVPAERREIRLIHTGPSEVQPSSPAMLTVGVVDPLRLVDQVQVYFRREGIKIFTVLSARGDESVSMIIPALSIPPDEKGYRMEYFVRVIDRFEGTLAEEGSPDAPRSFLVVPRAPDSGPVTSSWWFWGAVTASAIAVTGIVVLVLQPGSESIDVIIRDQDAGGGG